MLTEHYDINQLCTILEFALNGKYYMYTFNNKHKIIEKNVWKIQSPE